MSKFFDGMVNDLAEAVLIDRGIVPVEPVPDMPGPTLRIKTP